MKKIFLFTTILALVILVACKGKKKANDFLPVKSFLLSQVKHVDTSMYYIIKADKMNSDSTWDTSIVRREDFRKLAEDFLNIPDLTEYSIGKKYKEDKLFDKDINRVIVSYTPLKDDQELVKEDVVISPGETGTDQMQRIILEKFIDQKDSIIHQRLLWETNEKFQVVKIIEKNGQTIFTKTTEVTWNKPIQ